MKTIDVPSKSGSLRGNGLTLVTKTIFTLIFHSNFDVLNFARVTCRKGLLSACCGVFLRFNTRELRAKRERVC